MRAVRTFSRSFCALLVCFAASTAFASAGISVNKAFAPNSIALGGTSVVTVTLQNDSTSSAATITAFSDNIGTTMTGHASLLSSPAPTTTCSGGTPTVAGQVLSMNNGQIPIAPSVSTPGSCTITFSVAGAVSGNGFNTISAANVVTSLGSPGADVTQTLNVQGANVTATASSLGTVQTGDTNTVTFVVTNGSAVALTGVAFPITSSASAAYTVTGYTTSCGGTATQPVSGTTGTSNFSGLTVPASGTCTITLSITSPNSTTATFTLAAGAISDAQGATNSTAASTTAAFKSGKPTITKSFSPSAVVAGGTTTLTLGIQNSLTLKPLTNAAISDALPASLTILGTPAANANCGSPTLGGTGTGTLTFSGGTIAANATCTITVTVSVPAGQAAGTVTNTIPLTNFSSTEAASASAAASANLVVTAAGGGLTTTKTVSPSSANVGVAMKITLNFTSVGAALTAGTFSDVLPQTTQPMVALTDAGHAPTFSAGCGTSSPAVAFGGTGGNTTVSGSNLTLASGATCAVGFWVAFTAATSTTRSDTNTLSAANVSFTGSAGTIHPAADASVVLTQVPTFSINNYVASASGLAGQPLTVTATLFDSTGIADTNAVMVVNLTAGKVQLAPAPNFTFAGCPAGFSAANITINGAREQFTATLGAINATCSIGYDVINETGITGTYSPANSTYTSTLTGGNPVASTALNNVTFATTTINITKAFSPNQIQSGGNSTADITLIAPQAGTIARTQVNGIAFSDALPANVTFSPTPNVTFTGCQQTGQGAPAFSIAGTTISLTNVSLVTVGATQTACHVQFDVTSSVVGAPLNQIGASAITSSSGITNTQNALASLTVNSGLGIAKTFLTPSFLIGGTDYVRFLVTNSASSTALSGGTIVDAMPSALVLASTTLGAVQAGDPALCGGSVAGPVGTGTLNLSGLAVAGLTSPTAPGQCVVYVQAKASASAAPGSVSNTIAAGGLNVGGYINQVAATGSVTLLAPPNAAVSKSFAPALILPGAASVLSIVIDDTASGAAALNGMALTDTLPTGVRVAATPNASTTCGAGTVTAVAAATSVALASGSVAAGATCTISVSITGSSGGTFTNTIAANALTTTQGATNADAASAGLTIASVTLGKAFSPASITAGAVSTLTITIPNGATALTGIALTDTLPAGVTIAAVPNVATTCPSGTTAATAGGSSVGLSAGTLAANATCTLSVSVTATTAGTFTNTIAANALTTTQTVTNPTVATATITVALAGITLTKAFAPAAIVAGGNSLLTITIPNTAPGAVALTGMALTDTLPSGVTIAATPNGATTCPSGTVTAVAGSTSVALAGGAVAANASCTVSVAVTGTVAAGYTNTIAASALTTAQGVTNPAPATANLTINPNTVTLGKAFAPAAIVAGSTSHLTITIPNTATGAVPLSGMSLTDTLPSGLTIAATPNGATTCPAGTVTATAGGSSVALANGTVASNATCTVTVDVTGTVAASYTNTIPASALATTQNVTNAAAATATLAINLDTVTLGKTFAPAAIVAGSTSHLTITIPNTATGAVPLSGISLTDTLPLGVTIAATPNAATTCPAGTVTAVAGGTSVALAGGTVAANATCTVTVDVTGTVAASYINTIAASALTTTQGVTNAAAATANLAITPGGIALSKAFAPAAIVAGGTSLLTITIPNTATGAVPLSGMSLADTLPSGVTIAATPNAATTCPAGTVTAVAGGTSVALTGGTLAANATCTIGVRVTATTVGPHLNTIVTHALATTQNVSNEAPATASLTISAVPDVTLTKAFAPAAIVAGATSLLTITISNTASSSVPLSGLTFSDAYPSGLVNAASPAGATTCPAGSVTATAGGASLALSGATLAANASCTVTVNVAAAAGTYSNTVSSVTTTQGATNVAAATAGLTVIPAGTPTIVNAFSPASILASGISTLTIGIANVGTSAIALANLAFTDTLLGGLTIAPSPNATTTCASGSVAGTALGTTLSLSGASLAAGATCTVTIDVTSTSVGAHVNTIAANALTDAQGLSNAAPTSATLNVGAVSPVTVADTFSPQAIVSGQSSLLTIVIANTGSSAVALTGVSLSDALPAAMTLSATPAAATTCSAGTVSAAAGATSIALGGASLAAGASCSITVNVTSATLGTATDTILVADFANAQGVPSAGPASATLTVGAAAAVTLTQTFAPSSIVAGTTSVLTLSLTNAAAGAVALSGLALGDALPTGLVLAAVPNASTTCPSGTLAATAGAGTFALSTATLGAGATCTISLTVTAAAAGSFANTIAAGTLTSAQGASNTATTTTLEVTAVTAPLTLTKAFAPASIVSGGVSSLTITVANAASGAIALTSLALSDALPAGVAIAATPNAGTTCAAGTATASAGGATLSLANATLAAGATCTITVDVTSSVVGAHLDTSAVGTVTDAQNVSNAASASATLNVTAAPALGLTQAFQPASIAAGATSVLTITFANTAAGAIALRALAFSDSLPAGVVLAATPAAGTTCPGGNVSAVAGGATFALAGATLAANASCTVVVSVTTSGAGTYSNSIPAGAVSDAQGITNASTQATLTVAALTALRVTKTSDVAGAAVASGQTIAYTVTIVNPGTTLATGAKLIDVLRNATLVPNSVTIGGAAAPDSVVKAGVPFGSIAAGATVAIRYRVTVDAGIGSGGQVTDTATADSDGGCAGSACSGSAPADAVVSAPKITVSLLIDGKVSVTVTLGQVVSYSATLTNIGGVGAQNVMLTDTLPPGITAITGSVTVSNGASASTTSRARALASAVATAASGRSVTAALGTIEAGASATVAFRATITAPIAKVAANTVTVAATGIPAAVTSNVVVARMVRATLTVTKSASAVVAQIGDRVDYAVRIAAPTGIPFGQTTIVDRLPDYLSYAAGSARIDGVAIVPAVAGHLLTWTLPSLGVPVTLTYATAIAAGVSANATLSNLVTVSAAPLGGGPPGGGNASAAIQIAASTFGTCYPITGRVYDDVRGTGRFESGDTGLAGVSIVLDDGESVVTDAHGRYNFPCVRQGMHALRLDEKTLPDAIVPFADRAIDSERSIHRLVHGVFDDTILQDVNFAVTQRAP